MMSATAPKPPPGYVSLAELAAEIDPGAVRALALAKRLDKLIKDKHPLVALEAIILLLDYHLRRAPAEVRPLLAHQLGERIAAVHRTPVQ